MSSNAARLQLYLDAEARILAGQTVRFGDRELRRADLAEVRKAIAELSGAVAREQGGRGRFGQADFGGRT